MYHEHSHEHARCLEQALENYEAGAALGCRESIVDFHQTKLFIHQVADINFCWGLTCVVE